VAAALLGDGDDVAAAVGGIGCAFNVAAAGEFVDDGDQVAAVDAGAAASRKDTSMPTMDVLDSAIHEETGSGTALVLLHGNPGSSHLWRNVLPRLGRGLLAPDLIGMGRSGKPDISYSFADHARYLDAWFDALDLDRVVLIGHDWGGALAFDWADRHRLR
jgi:pimeloyl-ACP methyl ester carboxylesterase